MAEHTQQLIELRRLTAEDAEPTTRFLQNLPEGDLTFLKEPADDDTVNRWIADDRTYQWIAVGEDGELQAMLSIFPGALWSSHVAELRLVVGEPFRRQGLGRRLARHGLAEALLRDQICDRDGNVHDLVLLSHEVETGASALEALGLAGEVGLGEGQ